jgi:hypothetical protein
VIWAVVGGAALAEPALSPLSPYAVQTLAAMSPADARAVEQAIAASADFAQGNYAKVVETLGPTVRSAGFDALTLDTQYAVLAPYSHALTAMGDWAPAREALIALTSNPEATSQDWTLRLQAELVIDTLPAAPAPYEGFKVALTEP